jgi:predicted dehydrogenase
LTAHRPAQLEIRMGSTSHCVSRRSVLKAGTAAAVGVGGASLPAWFIEQLRAEPAPAQPRSANDTPGIALVGCGGRGRGDAKDAQKFGRIVAVCDVDASHREGAALEFGVGEQYSDFRKLMEGKDVDVIINGTPDHWHTLVNLHAVKCGKDVYTEKPLTLTIDEGKHLRAAVKKTGRVLQTGSQQRSDPTFRLAAELVRNGRLGKLKRITTFVPAGLNAGPFYAAPLPRSLDWDMWLGQAPKVRYVPQRCHLTFRFWYDYSGGTITDWGAHHNDIARWAIGIDGPVAVEGRPTVEMVPGGFTAASEYHVEFTYANGLKHVCRTTTSESPFGKEQGEPAVGAMRNGVFFEGEHGWIYVRRAHLAASEEALLTDPLPSGAERLGSGDDHMGNFFDCVRSRKTPVADVESAHRSVTMCHLGSIAIRLRRPLRWDPLREQFVGDDEANAFVAREQREPWTYAAV